MGVLAADVAPEGFLSARVDFIGRARGLASPGALETLDFFEARDTDAHATFDPIGSLLLGVALPRAGRHGSAS
jgi:cyclic beta-1,2-glucan synthetase